MDVVVYLKNGRIYDYNNIICIKESCNTFLYIYPKYEEPYTFKMWDIAMIKIKGGFYEHKEG